MRRSGPRSTRLLTGHRRLRPAEPDEPPGSKQAAADAQTWGLLDLTERPWAGGEPVVAPDPGRRRALVRRVWTWRLLLAGWVALIGVAALLGWRWFGLAGLGCPLLMLGPLIGMWWCSAVDLRQYDEIWGGY